MFVIYTIFSAVFWVPLVALLLWAGTLVLSTLEFSWLFVLIIAGIASIITGIVASDS